MALRCVASVLAVLTCSVGAYAGISDLHIARHDLAARRPVNEQPNYTFNELWDMHYELWTAFTYPNNVAQAKSINSTFFAQNIIGRVDITREFAGQELNTEYLFGLFTGQTLNNKAATLIGVPIAVETVHFAASQYVVSSANIVTFNLSSIILPIEIDFWGAYDSNKALTEYDVTIRRFDQVLDLLVANVEAEIGATNTTAAVEYLTGALATSICNTEVAYCNGTNQQYNNFSSCYDFLTQDIRFGTAYELGRNTLLCRMVHQYMVPFRPAVHCPHIGETGGGMCVDDQTYAQVVLQPLYTNAPLVPGGKASSNATVAAM